jgi:hypothetical protein
MTEIVNNDRPQPSLSLECDPKAARNRHQVGTGAEPRL